MKRFLIVTASVVVIIALMLSIGISFLKIYARNNVNYEIDDSLFEAARSSNTTTYYAYDSDGALTEVWKEASGARKSWVDIESVSPLIRDGFVAVEDHMFYKHNGINLRRTLAAAFNYIFRTSPAFGASTITQQVVKNISGDNERTARRKVEEILRAWHLEMTHSKEEILELYLNIVPMSGNIYGVREASLAYFGKEPGDVTAAEAATIIGITNSPARYDPYIHNEECVRKRNSVLYRMLDHKVISESDYESAVAEELSPLETGRSSGKISSWFIETARADIVDDLSFKMGISKNAASILLNNGTKVILTMNPIVQAVLEEYFEDLSNLSTSVYEGLEYAMVVTDSRTGDLAGIIGQAGKKEGNRLLNLANVPHVPGSTLKPIALYAPLIEQNRISWSTVFDDAPTTYTDDSGEISYYPKNSPDVYEGQITVADALKFSKNTVAVDMYNMLGGEQIFDNLTEKFGFNTIVQRELSQDGRVLTDLAVSPLALGQLTHGVTLRALTQAYTAFPSEGVLREGRSYYGVFDSKDKVLIENNAVSNRVFSIETANIMNYMLSGVVDDGTARGVTLKNLVDTAGKTGTSGSDRDRLFVGYTPYYTCGIWCGYENGDEIGVQSPSHIKIWDSVMKKIHQQTIFTEDGEQLISFSNDGVTRELYCGESGMKAADGCVYRGTAKYGFFKEGGSPEEYCVMH